MTREQRLEAALLKIHHGAIHQGPLDGMSWFEVAGICREALYLQAQPAVGVVQAYTLGRELPGGAATARAACPFCHADIEHIEDDGVHRCPIGAKGLGRVIVTCVPKQNYGLVEVHQMVTAGPE